MRGFITTWLEVAGLVLLAGAGAVAVGRFNLAGGMATGGALLVGASLLLEAARPKRKPAVEGESVA